MAHSLNISRKKVPGFQVLYFGQMDCSPGWSGEYTKYDQEGLLIHFVRHGEGKLVSYSEHKEYHIQAGEAFVFLPNTSYFYVADKDDPWSYVWFCIDGEQRRLTEEFIQSKHTEAVKLQDPEKTFKRLDSLFVYQPSSLSCDNLFYCGTVSLLLFDFLMGVPLDACLIRNMEGSYRMDNKRYIFLATGYIADNYSQNLSVGDIAKHVGIERSYFSRLFKRYTGMTVIEYLMRFRLNKAALLLENTDRWISDISMEVGFVYEHYFTQVFERYMGSTPSEYRKKSREKSRKKSGESGGSGREKL